MADTFRKEYTELTDAQKTNIEVLKTAAEKLEQAFEDAVPRDEHTPRVRLIKLAHTNLEQAVMWATKAASTPVVEQAQTQADPAPADAPAAPEEATPENAGETLEAQPEGAEAPAE